MVDIGRNDGSHQTKSSLDDVESSERVSLQVQNEEDGMDLSAEHDRNKNRSIKTICLCVCSLGMVSIHRSSSVISRYIVKQNAWPFWNV